MSTTVQKESTFLSLSAERRADLFYHAFQDAADANIIVGPDGAILYANRQAETLFGYRAEEMMDRPVEMLLPLRMREAHVADREAFFGHPVSRPMGRGVPLYGGRKNGSQFPAEIALSPIDYNGEVFVVAAVRNTSEWVRVDVLESRIYEPLARLIGLRKANDETDRAVREALDDVIEELIGTRPPVVPAGNRPS